MRFFFSSCTSCINPPISACSTSARLSSNSRETYSITEIGTYCLSQNPSLGVRVFFPHNLIFYHPATTCNIVCIVTNKRFVHSSPALICISCAEIGGSPHVVFVCTPNIAIVRVSSCLFRVEKYRALQISTTSGVCFLNGFTIHRWPAQRLFMQAHFLCPLISLIFISLITISVISVEVFLRSANNLLVISLWLPYCWISSILRLIVCCYTAW